MPVAGGLIGAAIERDEEIVDLLGVRDVDVDEPLVHERQLPLLAEQPGVELADGALGVGQHLRAGLGRREEEVGDGHVEHDGQQVELMGVESAPADAVEATFHGRDRSLGKAVAGQAGQSVGNVLLRHAPAFPDHLDVVRDDRVDVHAVLPRRSLLRVGGRLLLLAPRPNHAIPPNP